jgi:predicted metallopeptidase
MALVNEQIIEKIDKSKCDEKVKMFLKELLSLELEHFEEGRWRFSEKYEWCILNLLKEKR